VHLIAGVCCSFQVRTATAESSISNFPGVALLHIGFKACQSVLINQRVDTLAEE
jgi:hypothetical protein